MRHFRTNTNTLPPSDSPFHKAPSIDEPITGRVQSLVQEFEFK